MQFSVVALLLVAACFAAGIDGGCLSEESVTSQPESITYSLPSNSSSEIMHREYVAMFITNKRFGLLDKSLRSFFSQKQSERFQVRVSLDDAKGRIKVEEVISNIIRDFRNLFFRRDFFTIANLREIKRTIFR